MPQPSMQRERFFFYSLCLIAFLIPFDIKFTNTVIIASFILWLLSAWKNIRVNWPAFRVYFFLFISLYLINIPGLIHTENLSGGFGRLESRLSYMAFPLMIFFSTLGRQHFRMISYIFCLGILVSSLYCLGVSLDTFIHTDAATRSISQLTYLHLIDPLQLHPTYFSIFISYAVFFLFSEILSHQRDLRRWILVVLTIYFVVLNFLLQSRAPLATFILIVLGSVMFMIFSVRNVTTRLITLVIFILIAVGASISFKKVMVRFDTPFHEIAAVILQPDDAMEASSKSTRSTVAHLRSWYCSSLLLSDYHFLTGYGSGDEKDVLEPCYTEHGWSIMAQERQNAHNEYLSAMLRMGLVELALLLCYLFIPLYLSIKHRYFLYTTFLLLWITCFFFSTLNLQSAMFFYTLFNALFFRILLLQVPRSSITFQTTKDTLPAVS